MRIPRTGSEVTSEWLETVLETYEKKSRPEVTCTVNKFEVNPGTKPGESFNSDLFAVEIDCQIKDGNGSEKEDKKYSLILKFHCSDIFTKEINKLNMNHIREMAIYSRIHKTLMEYQEKECEGAYKLNIPTIYYTYNEGEDYVLAMENLKPLGYAVNDKLIGLNVHQLKMAVRQLARWHALSFVYHKKFNIWEEFPELLTNNKSLGVMLVVAELALKNIHIFLSKRGEFPEICYKLGNHHKQIIEELTSKFIPKDVRNTESLCCLGHGDFWNNNILYLNDKQGDDCVPNDISIVDWQMCSWNRPVIDLQYLLYTSTTYEVRKEHLDDILKTYYAMFEEIVLNLHFPLPDLNYDLFKKEFDDAFIIGFVLGICLTFGTLSKAGEKLNRNPSSSPAVRGIPFTIKTKVANSLAKVMTNPSMSFILKAGMKKMLAPVLIELMEGENSVMINRMLGLIKEADEKGTKPGDNFNSDLFAVKIDCQIKDGKGPELEDKNYNLILKFHCSDVFTKEMNKLNCNHVREMTLYSRIHKTLMDYQEKECEGAYKLNIPSIYYTYNEGEDYVLAIENLKPLGYIVNDKVNGLNAHQLKIAVKQLARWHALSFVYHKKFDFFKEFPELLMNDKNTEMLLLVAEQLLKNIHIFLSKREEFPDICYKLGKHQKQILEELKSKLILNNVRNTESLCCLVHGDFWNNNILYLQDKQGDYYVPNDVSIVDWQMCSWNRPVIDLHYLLYSSTTYEVRKEHLYDILKTYYSMFEEIVLKLHSPLPNITYESFKKEFDDTSIIGFAIGLCYSQGTLSKAGEKFNRNSTSIPAVRGIYYTIKTKVARNLTQLCAKPSMSFLLKAGVKQMFAAINKELLEGDNSIMNERVLGIIQEADEKGIFSSIGNEN